MSLLRRLVIAFLACSLASACLITADENLWKKDQRADQPRPPDSARPEALVDAADAAGRELGRDARGDRPPGDSPRPDLAPDLVPPKPEQKPDQFVSCPHPQVVESCAAGWCTIPKGCFLMGSPVGEACRDATDEILHEVTLTRDFEIAQTEVTQQQFNAILKQQPSSNKTCGSNCPVETVTWHEAASYCNGLSESLAIAKCYKCSGQPPACSEETAYAGAKIYTCPGYRLPTEAEWEYAYRAGTKTSSHGGAITGCATSDAAAGAIGWFSGNSAISIHPVSQKLKNAWGLFDMAGNVYEWANDWYSLSLGAGKASDPWGPATGTNKVVRGGGFNSDARYLRAANREPATGPQSANTGFRCVRSK